MTTAAEFRAKASEIEIDADLLEATDPDAAAQARTDAMAARIRAAEMDAEMLEGSEAAARAHAVVDLFKAVYMVGRNLVDREDG